MNIRKALLLILIVAIATLGLTLTGCEKKSDQPPAEPATPQDMVDAAEQVKDEANQATEDAKEAVEEATAEHPTSEHPK